jgi:DNA (cytosine-5)-methyltransferase 1
MLRLQGFPDDFKIVVSYAAIRRLAGNSVAVPVISAIAQEMLKSIQQQQPRCCQQLQFGNM